MTNSASLFKAFNGKFCPGDHEHQVISGNEGGMKRSQAAQAYPDSLCTAISKALLEDVKRE